MEKVVIACALSLPAFTLVFLFDWASYKKIPRAKLPVITAFIGLQGYALYLSLWDAPQFEIPQALSVLGWAALPFFLFLLVLSLAIELPSAKTYSGQGTSGSLIKTGTYALTRHPGVLWYLLAMFSLAAASRSALLLAAAPVWSALNVILAFIEDQYLFPRMFPGYIQYRKETPMLLPTPKSLTACLKTLKKPGTTH